MAALCNDSGLITELTPPTSAVGALSCTSGWDLVVSYSCDKLNTALQTLWTGSSAPLQNLQFTTPYQGLFDSGSIAWTISLTAPTLQFVAGSHEAVLVMKLSGSGVATETGSTTSNNLVIPDGHTLNVTVPLSAVTASEGKITNQATQGQTINFASGSSEVYITFDFSLVGPGSGLVIQPELGVGVWTTLIQGLTSWFNSSGNVSAIDYALATVSNSTPSTSNSLYLTPKSLAFATYVGASSGGATPGCLSVYIQTEESGFDQGNPVPSFAALSDGSGLLPITSDHDASIIISRNVFGKTFLANAVANVTSTLGSGNPPQYPKAFTSATLGSSASGLVLSCPLNTVASEDMGSTNWFGGGFSADKVNWNLGSPPVTLTVANSTSTWSYSFSNSVGWDQVSGMGEYTSNQWGTVDYSLTCNAKYPLFTFGSDQDLIAQIKLASSDFVPSTSPESASFGDRILGKVSYIPPEIADGLGKITLPSVSSSLELDYFATTNVFAPGKHMISIAGIADIYTPYDVVLLGTVISNPNAQALSNSIGKITNGLVNGVTNGLMNGFTNVLTNGDALRSIRMSTPNKYGIVRAVTPPQPQLAQDFNNSSPVIADLLAALQSSTPDAFTALVSGGKYSLTEDDFSSMQKLFSSGPGFSLNMIGGLYQWNSGAQAGANNYVMIDNRTGKMYQRVGTSQPFQWGPLKSSVNADGSVNVTYGGNPATATTYQIAFTQSYDTNGLPTAIAFTGHQLDSNGNATGSAVGGQQIFISQPPNVAASHGFMLLADDPNAHWFNNLNAQEAAFIASFVGMGLPYVTAAGWWCLKKAGKAVDGWLHISQAATNAYNRIWTHAQDYNIPTVPNAITTFKADLAAEVQAQVTRMANDPTWNGNMQNLNAMARAAVNEKIQARIGETIGPQLQQKLADNGFENLLNAAAKRRLVAEKSATLAEPFKDQLNGSTWVANLVEQYYQQHLQQKALVDADTFRQAAEQASDNVTQYQADVAQMNTALDTLKKKAAANPNDQAAQDAVTAEEQKIQDKTADIVAEQQRQQQAEDNEKAQQDAADNAEADSKHAKQQADTDFKGFH